MMSNKLTKMSFEEKYPDGSAVKKSVSYDSSISQDGGLTAGEIRISDCSDCAEFSIGDIDWLIGCLERIKAESKESE